LTDLLGVTLSTGTLTTIVESTGTALGPFLAAVREQLIAAPVAHFDETGLRVAGRSAWVHSASTASLALFTAHPTRGQDAMTDAGVLPAFTGTAVHDGWTPYRRYGTNRQLCNAHHLRDLAAILDLDPTQTWAADMTRLLCEINDMTRTARTNNADALHPRLLHSYHQRYHAIITAGRTANPAPEHRPTRPPRHPTAQPAPQRQRRTPAVNLIARLHGFANDVLRFAHDLNVPFDNNLAERDIRMVKLRQKISGGLRTWTGAHTFTNIRSYLATTHKHGINALEALTQLHNGHPWMPPTTT
jgi:transposase